MVGDFGCHDHFEFGNLDLRCHQHVVGKAALLQIVGGSRVYKAVSGDEIGKPESGKNPKGRAVGQHVEIAADDEPFVAGPDALDEPDQRYGLFVARCGIALACGIAQAMHVGDSYG